ncbi:MAG: hypothetical protein ACI84R_003110 [Candidatus Azotimanducaceae bacterium]|jgi:hypothetical protein
MSRSNASVAANDVLSAKGRRLNVSNAETMWTWSQDVSSRPQANHGTNSEGNTSNRSESVRHKRFANNPYPMSALANAGRRLLLWVN